MSLFSLGKCVATPAAVRFCDAHGIDLLNLLGRHRSGDWGDLEPEDRAANQRALQVDLRLLSSYTFPAGKVWIITEADRSSTCVLLPSDY